MTPFQLFRETPVRIRSWPLLWKVLVCSALSTMLAVVLMAWQASRFRAHRHDRPVPAATWQVEWPTTAQIRQRMEIGCAHLDVERATRTGLYAEDAP